MISYEADSCDRCGRKECLLNSKMVHLHGGTHRHAVAMLTPEALEQDRMNLDEETSQEPPERLRGLDACTLSLILGHSVEARSNSLGLPELDADQFGCRAGPGNASFEEPVADAGAVAFQVVEEQHPGAAQLFWLCTMSMCRPLRR